MLYYILNLFKNASIYRLKELEYENTRLKRMYADLSLENAALKDIVSKKF